MDLINFDIISYLKFKGIPIYTEGKNVSPGWVGVKCLWCSDKTNHLGINLHSKTIKCWKCKHKGTAFEIVQKLENCSWYEVEHIAENYFDIYVPEEKSTWVCKVKPEDVMPKGTLEAPLPMHIEYLEKRNFDISEIIRKYKICFTDHRGRLKFRIVIPIIMDRRIVGFTARDITDKAELRYISSDLDKYLVDPDTVMYNFDTVGDTAIVVEGCTDVWRMGEGSFATLGTEFNNWHVKAMLEKGIRRVFILFDPEPEAQKLAEKMASMLSVCIPETEIIELSEGDPGSLSPSDALLLKKELTRKFY